MSTRKKSTQANKPSPIRFSIWALLFFGLFMLGREGILTQQAEQEGVSKSSMSITLPAGEPEAHIIPLRRSAPVGTLTMNGKTYTIWSNKNDQLR
ncbi:MAG: hypothetical protein AAF840_09060 [Bacteroidota bacterium]